MILYQVVVLFLRLSFPNVVSEISKTKSLLRTLGIRYIKIKNSKKIIAYSKNEIRMVHLPYKEGGRDLLKYKLVAHLKLHM